MVGRTTLSGVQRKISVNLSADRQTLQVALGPGRFILKPQASTFPELPENELVTLRVAEMAGINIPPCGLLALADGSMAYVARRFDRLESGQKLRQEDFCQLAEYPPKRKYDGSAELCARLVRQYATEPAIESLKLFRQMFFCWWTGNGDAHLKNFSLLIGVDGIVQLSPAYDLLCTRLVLPDDHLALPVGGKQDGLRRAHWEEFGKYCGLPDRSIARELARIAAVLDGAIDLVSRSPLSASFRTRYVDLLRDRAAILAT
jgi:serine/threonine-protein kinase HipA